MIRESRFSKQSITRELAVITATFATLLTMVSSSYAWVTIVSPRNDSNASGTITVKASVSGEWWSMLVVDGKPVVSGTMGSVDFKWDTTKVSDGPHWVEVRGYQKGKTVADASEKVAVSVLNHASSDKGTYFGTRSASSPLPSGSWCAQVIPQETEPVSTNTPNDTTKPTSAQLQSYAANGYAANLYNGAWAFARANGQYTGTTDMILRWAACKWGVDEDVVRAQTMIEHWNWDQNRGGDMRTSEAQCVNGSFTSLWNYHCSDCCYQSWSIFQTKVYYNWQTWPMMLTSTPFAADYRYATFRSCMNGDMAERFIGDPDYNGHNYRRDIASGDLSTIVWGCVGLHYSGKWYDGNSTTSAIWYIGLVQNTLAKKAWKIVWPSVNWPN